MIGREHWGRRARRPKRCRSGRRVARSTFELLEPRNLLAVIAWDGGGDGTSWSDPMNWDGDQLPTVADDAVIDVAEDPQIVLADGLHVAKSLLSLETVRIQGGTLQVTDGIEVHGTFTLQSGQIVGGTIAAGTTLHALSGTLDGVTVAGDLDLTSANAELTIESGLVLDGTATLGQQARMDFSGTQTLSGGGTVEFNDVDRNALRPVTEGMTLTIGAGITIRGGSTWPNGGVIGHSLYFGGVTNFTIVNQGTIAADVAGTSLTILQGSLDNQGTLEAKNGATLNTNHVWSSTGTLRADGGTLNLLGQFVLATSTLEAYGSGRINLKGTLDNTGQGLDLTGDGQLWLQNSTILGGAIAAGTTLHVLGGTLDGVTVAGDLDLTTVSAQLTIASGLVLDGTATLGQQAHMDFSGTQTLAGTGTVVFNDVDRNALRPVTEGMTLTIGAGITIRGGSAWPNGGAIGHSPYFGGVTNFTIVNQGTIAADVAGTSLTVRQGSMDNRGALVANAGSLTVAPNTATGSVVNEGMIRAANGGQMQISRLIGNLNDAEATDTDSTLSVQGVNYVANQEVYAGTGTTVSLDGQWTNSAPIVADGGTVNLRGAFTLAPGSLEAYGLGRINVVGILDNTGIQLSLLGDGQLWLQGGTILGGAVAADTTLWAFSNTTTFLPTGTLDTVTINGELRGGAMVRNGLILNGTARLQGLTFNRGDILEFLGTQSFGGTGDVILDGGRLRIGESNTSLTIESGVSVSGTGWIGFRESYFGQPTADNTTFVIHGMITASNYLGLSSNGINTTFINHGTLKSLAGGNLSAANGITSFGPIVADQGMVNLPGNLLLADGSLEAFGAGRINISGVLNNVGRHLSLVGDGQLWLASQGTIRGGVIASGTTLWSGSGSSRGTLDGVTIDGQLIGTTRIINGLTVNGSVLLRQIPFAGEFLDFVGTQTLGGSGEVILEGGILRIGETGTSVTIGPELAVRGRGSIGYFNTFFGLPAVDNATFINQGTVWADLRTLPSNFNHLMISANGANTSFINQGTLKSSTSGSLTVAVGAGDLGTIVAEGANAVVRIEGSGRVNNRSITALPGATITVVEPIANLGTVTANGGIVQLSSLTGDSTGALNGAPSGIIRVAGDLLGQSVFGGLNSHAGQLILNGTGTAAVPQRIEVMSADRGANALGYESNFTVGRLDLVAGTYAQLVDLADNSTGIEAETLYVDTVVIPSGATLDLNGSQLYTRHAQIDGSLIGGTLAQVPDSGPIAFGTKTPGNISSIGEIDEWTFFGSAGQEIAIEVLTGGAGITAPLAPQLGFGEVVLVDPNSGILATDSNAVSGEAILQRATLPISGIYGIRVMAPAGQPASVGNYIIGVHDAAVVRAPLQINQQHHGTIGSSYAAHEWEFSAAAGQQVRFDLISAGSSAIRFALSGPDAWQGFMELNTDSELLTLPATGQYTLSVSTTSELSESYAFKLVETQQIELPLGVDFPGVVAGTDHAQIFRVDVPLANPLQLRLLDQNTANRNEVYLKFGAPPTRSDYDFGVAEPTADQQLLVPLATSGSWYALVYTSYAAVPGDFTLRADSMPVAVTGVSPDRYGADESAILSVSGAGFVPGTLVELVAADQTALAAEAIGIDSFDRLTATFSLLGVPTGTYDVRVSLPGGASHTLPSAFQVLPSGEATLETRLSAPSALGLGAMATLYVEYANTGTAAMAAPVLVLQSPQRPLLTLDQSRLAQGFWTSADPDGFANTLQIHASGATPGLLLPGESVRVSVYYIGLQDFGLSVEFELRVFRANSPDPVDWDALRLSQKPAWMSADAWDVVFANLMTQVGATWGDYVRMLSENASYLGRLGQKVTDVDRLYGFELQQAIGLNPISVVASAVDAALPAPGLPLRFSRSFGNTITQRYQLGEFGYGWVAPRQPSLEQLADGTVIVHHSADNQRRFQPDRRYPGQFISTLGDSGKLRDVGGGVFELTESSGIISRFRTDGTLEYTEDTSGNRISTTFVAGQLASLTHSNGTSLAFSYNAGGRIASISDSAGSTTTFTYDVDDLHLLTATSPGGTTTYTYSIGNGAAREHALLSVTDPSGHSQFFDYDDRGRLIAAYHTGDAERTEYAYDSVGRVTITNAVGQVTSQFYDDRGLLARSEDSTGQYIRYEYDAARRLIRETNSLGQSRAYEWCSCGQLVSVTNELGQTARFTLGGPLKRPSAFTDANGNITRFVYDAAGDLTTTTYPDGSIERAVYDAQGNPVSLVNRRGQAVTLAYNAAGQIALETFPGGATNAYMYDAGGRMTSVTSTGQGTTTFTYDSADRLALVDYPNGRWLEYEYDAAGRRTRMEDHSGFVVQYSYDGAGRLSELRDGTNELIVGYIYDSAGQLIREDKGNGTYTVYGYDASGRVQSIQHHAPDDSLNSQFVYAYDTLSRRIGTTMLDGAWTYSYDPTGQLVRAVFDSTNSEIADQDLSYEYDALGNRVRTILNGVSTNYNANNMNQYSAAGETSYTYDLDGNLVLEISSAGTRQYTYDARNRLVRVDSPEGTWQYEYNAFGNRTAMVVNGQRTEYLLDPTGLVDVLAEYDGSGNRTVSYVHGLGLAGAAGSEGWFFYDFDALGSTAGVSGFTGGYANQYVYDPFGNSLLTAETFANPFQFIGMEGVMNDENGLTFMRARYYDAITGRFMAQDPIRLEGGDQNLYRYVENAPLTTTDPSGLFFALEQRGCALEAINLLFGKLTSKQEELLRRIAGGENAISEYFDACKFRDYVQEQGTAPQMPISGGQTGGGGGLQYLLPVRTSVDPNEKIGPAGFGDEHFVQPGATIPYRINFENLGPGSDPTPAQPATAPAQHVRITDQLSPNLDWDSLEFTELGFGDVLIAVPPGSQYFQTVVTANLDGVDFAVVAEARFDLATGLITVDFYSLDPVTGLPPDVLTGFLPPEDGTGRGKGHFSFTILPQSNLATGTAIPNIAVVSFDSQATIATNQLDPFDPASAVTDPSDPDYARANALITIDSDPPASSVDTLPATSPSSTVTISWSGDDGNGSGIGSYNVYVSTNGGEFTPLLENTSDSSMVFQGVPLNEYSFYTLATDHVGNRQISPIDIQSIVIESESASGDMDGDGDIDFDDIDDFVFGLNDPAGYEATYGIPPEAAGDIDMDGDLDFDDIDDFVALLNAGLSTSRSASIADEDANQAMGSAYPTKARKTRSAERSDDDFFAKQQYFADVATSAWKGQRLFRELPGPL